MIDNIESVEVVLMNKESIFEDEYIEDEYFNVTKDKDVWSHHIKRHYEGADVFSTLKVCIDDNKHIEAFVDSFDWYMTSPTAKLGRATLMARVFRVNDLDALSDIDVTNSVLYAITQDERDGRYTVRYASRG